jgi:hypothetical protein
MSVQQKSTSVRVIPMIIVLACAACGFTGILVRSFFGAPFVPQPGDTIDIRGDRIAILRLPTKPIQELAVYQDGHVNRYTYPITPNVYTQIVLTANEKREFEQFRTVWCQGPPSFRALAPDESFYDLGVLCAGDKIKQAKVPEDMLPVIFTTMLKRLLPPSPA